MVRKFVSVVVVAVVFLVLAGLGSAATNEQMEQRAFEAMKAGQYTQAVSLWQKVLERRPGLPRALYNLACCYSRTGELDKAALRLEEAYEAGISYPELPQSDPDLEALRESKKGKALIDRLVSEAEQLRWLRGVPGFFEAPVLGGYRVVTPRVMKENQKYPMVMILHGHGANPENYVGIFEGVSTSPEAIVCAPYGPYPIPLARGHGYSWFPAPWFFQELLRTGRNIGARAQRRKEIEQQEQAVSRRFVLAAIDHLSAEYPVDSDRIFLLGHSEGGVMAYGLALEHPDLFRGLIVVGARLRESDAVPHVLTGASGQLDVLICHSRQDKAISFDNAKTAFGTLKAAGIQTKLFPYAGGHGLTTELVQAIGRWIAVRPRL